MASWLSFRPRHSIGTVLAASVFFHPLPAAGATPAPPVAPTRTYVVDNHGQRVTVRDGAGKLILTRHISTPRLVIAVQTPTPRPGMVTLQDENGVAFWSIPLRVNAPLLIRSSPAKSQWRMPLTFTASAESLARNTDIDTPHRLTMLIDADDRFTTGQADGKPLSAAASGDAKGFELSAMSTQLGMHRGTDAKHFVLDLPSGQVTLESINRDGKDYTAFAWNGHKVFVEQPCKISFDSDGNLTINKPSDTGAAKQ